MENNFPENQILQRYNVALDKNILYSYEELRSINIDEQFIYSLLQTFEDEKSFSEEEYNKYPLEIKLEQAIYKYMKNSSFKKKPHHKLQT